MRHTFLLFALVLVSCDTSNSSSGDGGATTADSGPASHPLCVTDDAGPGFPAGIGAHCGMGSNLDLCATDSSSCETGICLWHGSDPAKVHAYCTIACEPGQPNPCPPRFACKAQGCSMSPAPSVCVRVAADPVEPCEQTDTILPGRSPTLRSVAAVGGRIYLAGNVTGGGCVVLTRETGESAWSLIHDKPCVGFVDATNMTAPDAVFFRVYSGSTQQLLRAAGTTVTEETLPPCDGDPNRCLRSVEALFVTTAGELRGVGRNHAGDDFLLRRGAGGAWSVERPLDFKLVGITALRRAGLAASCRRATDPWDAPQSLCLTGDGQTIETLELPAGRELGQYLSIAGQSPDDLYLYPGAGSVLHRVQGLWLEEGLPVSKRALLGQLADGALYASLESWPADGGAIERALYTLEGGCWQAQPGALDPFGLAPLEGKRFLHLSSSSKLCTTDLY